MKQTAKNASPKSNAGRNHHVVEHITNALLELMDCKEFNSITVSEICEKAGVGRASFYRNFESKEDIIRKHLHNLLEEWWASYTGTTIPELVTAIFEYFYECKNIYILFYKQGLDYISLQSVKDSCGPNPNTTMPPLILPHSSPTVCSAGLRSGLSAVCRKRPKKWQSCGNAHSHSHQRCYSSDICLFCEKMLTPSSPEKLLQSS